MGHDLSDQQLLRLSELVAERLGLHFPPDRWRDLASGVRAAAQSLGYADAAACAHGLLSARLTRREIELLAAALTVGETYFFRDRSTLNVIGERILPELIRARRGTSQSLRIWSAGCCTGEEAYSLAILIDRILPDASQWQVTILGTDVNAGFVQRAREAIFGEWSFRDVPPWLKQGYFRALEARRFELAPRIRAKVTFSHLNLAEDFYPSPTSNTNAMDIILCRNVLMYFEPQRARDVVERLYRSLVPGGWLLVGPAETSATLFSQFRPVQFEGATLYSRDREPTTSTRATSWPEWATLPEPVHGPTSASWNAAAHSTRVPMTATQSGTDASTLLLHLEAPLLQALSATAPVPDEVAAHGAALKLYQLGNYRGAVRQLEAMGVPSGPGAKHAELLARSYANLGELGDAKRWAERALEADTLNAGMHYLRALILQEQDSIDEARACLKRALYLSPQFVLAHVALGNLARRAGRRQEADRYFTNALELLEHYADHEVLPDSDGLAVGLLRQTIRSVVPVKGAA
jgi:chemotaxis protein methyltransferase CheR